MTDILFYIAILLTFRYVTLNAIHNDILYIKIICFVLCLHGGEANVFYIFIRFFLKTTPFAKYEQNF